MIDVLSGGRLVAGFPVGTPMDTTFRVRCQPGNAAGEVPRAVDLILRAWKSDRPFAFNGKYTQLRYVNPWPLPLQQPHPPVWIPEVAALRRGSGASTTISCSLTSRITALCERRRRWRAIGRP